MKGEIADRRMRGMVAMTGGGPTQRRRDEHAGDRVIQRQLDLQPDRARGSALIRESEDDLRVVGPELHARRGDRDVRGRADCQDQADGAHAGRKSGDNRRYSFISYPVHMATPE